VSSTLIGAPSIAADASTASATSRVRGPDRMNTSVWVGAW
jgi:hypothetical protein